jgi:HAE1 family hydrophobic/amphiphilic exporter-1
VRPIIQWCLGNRAVVLLLGLVLIGGGIASIFQLNQELLPSLSLPAVFVVVPDPGAGPQQVDRDVTQPLMTGLSGMPKATHVQSQSIQGMAQIVAFFDYNTSLKDDLDAVNQRLGTVQLPAGAQKPLVQTFDTSSAPSMVYSLAAADGDVARTTREARDVILPALAGAGGLAQVKVVGGQEQSITVTLDPAKLAAHGLSPAEVGRALQAAHVDLPAGEAARAGKQLPVQVVGGARSAADLRSIAVGGPSQQNPDARPVKLGDVATVSEGSAPAGGISRTDGQPAIQIQVMRAQNGNAVTLSQDVTARLAKLHLDPNDRLQLISDDATDIRASLNDLVLEGLLGALLAIFVIFLFLRSVTGTLVTAVSLPMSVLVALIGTEVAGFSLNVLTLAGLTIALGRIVDDAIVVLENSYRHIQQGESAREAALNGTSEVVLAIVSSTLTTVAVFLPIGLVGGLISKLFLPFSVTVAISLLASLVVAVTIVPVLVSIFLGRWGRRFGHSEPWLARAYRPVLGWALSRGLTKATVLVLAVGLLGGSVYVATKLPVNLFDLGGSNVLNGQVTLPVGTSLDETSRQLQAFEQHAQADPQVRLVQVSISDGSGQSIDSVGSTNVASLTVLLKSKQGADGVARRLKGDLEQIYGAGSAEMNVQQSGGTNNRFQVTLQGTDPVRLQQASDQVIGELRGDGELTNVKSGLAAVQPQLLVTVDATKAAAHGLTPDAVAGLISGALGPQQAGRLGPNGPALRVRVDPNAVGADRLASLPLAPGVALADVATISDQLAPSEIDRQDGTEQVTVDAAITGHDTQGASSRAQQRVQKLTLPAGVSFATGGAAADIGTSFTSMFEAIGIAVAAIFLILVIFFRSVATPFVILLTMPLALIGSITALLIFHQALGLPALLGVLLVFGIVVSNAILLIDFAERGRRSGLPLRTALLRAGSVRLRPILMTAVATIAALLPVALGISSGGGGGLISQSLAIVVEGGLVSSTLLTLLVVPVVYSLFRRDRRERQRAVAEGDAA